jgi:hypothetical protein
MALALCSCFLKRGGGSPITGGPHLQHAVHPSGQSFATSAQRT